MGNYNEILHFDNNINVSLVRQIGEGGYGYVFEASDITSNLHYALKRMVVQSKERQKLVLDEIHLLESLPPHENIVKYYGTLKQQNENQNLEYLLLFEFCPNGSIGDFIRQHRMGGPLSPKIILMIFSQACRAVLHLHSQSPPIAHRDIKSENFLFNGRTLKLCDFGSATTVSKVYKERFEIAQEEERVQKHSTTCNASPELLNLYSGRLVNEKVDVWALGCILFNLAYYQHPFADSSPLRISNAGYLIPDGFNAEKKRNIPRIINWMLNIISEERPNMKQVCYVIEKLASNPNDESWMKEAGYTEPSTGLNIEIEQKTIKLKAVKSTHPKGSISPKKGSKSSTLSHSHHHHSPTFAFQRESNHQPHNDFRETVDASIWDPFGSPTTEIATNPSPMLPFDDSNSRPSSSSVDWSVFETFSRNDNNGPIINNDSNKQTSQTSPPSLSHTSSFKIFDSEEFQTSSFSQPIAQPISHLKTNPKNNSIDKDFSISNCSSNSTNNIDQLDWQANSLFDWNDSSSKSRHSSSNDEILPSVNELSINDTSVTSPNEITIGARMQILYKKQIRDCTIRYIGSLENKEGKWIGIELDTPIPSLKDGMGKFDTEIGKGLFLQIEGS